MPPYAVEIGNEIVTKHVIQAPDLKTAEKMAEAMVMAERKRTGNEGIQYSNLHEKSR